MGVLAVVQVGPEGLDFIQVGNTLALKELFALGNLENEIKIQSGKESRLKNGIILLHDNGRKGRHAC